MRTQPTHHRQVTTLVLSIAVLLALDFIGAFAGEQIQPAGPMAVARRGHTATVLADGRVLIVGGLDGLGPLSAAEIFDPVQKTFAPAGNLVSARYGHTATLLVNGRVFIAGGQDASGPLASAEIFDPADTNGFRLISVSMGVARVGHTATLRSDGTVLLAGGDPAGTAEIFDPVTESFYMPLVPMAAPRAGHTATPLAGDNVFMVGGGTTSIEVFNAASNSFSLWPIGLSQIRYGHASIPTTGGQLLVIGGDQSGTFELFDPLNGSSPLSLSLGTPNTTANLLANNKILVLGPGVSGLFDQTSRQLSAMVDTNATLLQLNGHTATELPTANRQVLVAGGIDSSNNLLSSATLYNPATISTDAGDYPPFSWVNIYGAGFLPNETVTNQVEEIVGPEAGTNFAPWGVTADTNGAFTTLWQVFSDELLNTTLKLSAVGQTSGLKAETEFTDAGGKTIASVTAGGQSGALTAGTAGSATFAITASTAGSGSEPNITYSVTAGLPTGATASFSPNPAPASSKPTFPSTLTITTLATTPAGVFTLTIRGADDNGGTPQTTTATLTVKRPITVTATSNTKTYDATTSAAAVPTITSGTLAAGDTATLTATYDTKNAGSGKTLEPVAVIKNSSNVDVTSNYTITFVNNTTGVINARVLTVTAAANSKTYDGTTSAAATPTVTSGVVQTGDTANFTETYDTKNAGTGKTLTPSGTVTDGNSGNNYTYTFVTAASGTITARALTVTAATNTKTYDATTSASATPTLTSGTTQTGDTANFTETYDTKNAGTGKTLTPAGTVSDGNSGNNYAYSFVAVTTGVINTRALTVTATTNTKTYDGTTSAAATPTVTSGVVQTGDTANFTEAYSNKNAGTGKTLAPSGTVLDGNSGNNYTYTFVNNTTGVINALALTVTAATNTKTYDGATAASATPTVTSGAIQTGDTANFAETYASKNAGTGKTLTPSGTVTDGNSGNNYTYTFVNNTTGVINALAITVTAAANTKTYDGTTSATATPTISPALASGDTSGFTETYDTKNVGTGKTLAPSGSVNDGNSGNNYAVTFTSATTGVINIRALTVTAATNTKTYDGTTSAAATPIITLGAIQTGDTASFTEAYASKNAGTGKTLTPSGIVMDGNSGNNYTYTFVNSTTGVINARALTVTAATNTKTYDGTTSAAATPTITVGAVQTGDTANFTEAYSNKNAGTGKTLTPSGAVTDGNGGANYTVTFANNTTGVINALALTVTAATNTKTYDGTSTAAATPTITSGAVQTGDTANFTEAYNNKNVGTGKTLAPSGTVTDGNGGLNYTYTFVNDTTGIINARALTVTATANTKPYDATTSAAAIPTIASGAVQTGDTANFTETYDTKNVGTTKILTPAGTVVDGNSGNNYTYTFVPVTTGGINARALTVTAVTNTKTYDATTAAAAIPTITSGTLQDSETANFIETYDTKNAGTGKTLTPSGAVNDGNSGANYTYNFISVSTGVINKRALTITAQPNTKVYDATIAAVAVPAVTSGTIQDSETPNFTETYDTKNVGTGKTLTASGTINDGNSGLNYSYTFVTSTAGVITARPLTVTAQTFSKGYDGTTSAAATPLITLGGLQDSETANFTEAYSSRSVGTGKTLIPSGTVNDGNSGLNYTYTFVNNTTGVITARTLTVTATAQSKVYDSTTAATVTLSDNRIAGDVFTDSDTGATFSDKNVATGKTVTVSGILISGTDAGNYALSSTIATATADITAKSLTVTATAADKVYDDTTAANVTFSDNRFVGDVFTDSSTTATFSDKNVGSGKTVTVSGISISGTDAGNYNLASTTATTTASITARTVTGVVTINDKVYDGNTTATVATYVINGVLDTDHVNAAGTLVATFTPDRNVGVNKTVDITGMKITGPDSGNYVLASDSTTALANITSRPLSITAATNTKTYDGNTSAAAIPAVVGLQDADTATGLSEVYADRNAGTGKTLIPSGTIIDAITHLGSGNYTVSFVNNTSGVINKAALTITAATNTKGYDGTTSAAATPITSGLRDSDTVTGVVETYDTKNVGTAKTLTVSAGYTVADGNSGNNYTVTLVANNTGVITKATLTITANLQTKVYGQSDPALTYVATGFQTGDTAASVLSGSLTRAAGEHVAGSPYAISQGTLAADTDYTIAFTGNNLTITVATLTVTADPQTKVYGSADPALTYKAIGFQFTDTGATVLSGMLNRAPGEHVAGSPYPISQGTLAADTDYTIAFSGNNLTITVATLTVTADPQTKVYGSSDPALTYKATGFQFADTGATILSGMLTRAPGEHVVGSPYPISQGTLAANSDYTIAFTGNNLTITVATVTVTADPQTKVYGASDPALIFVATGLQFSDTAATVLTGSLTRAAGEHVASYAISQGSLAADSDYTISFTGNTLTITPATLTVKADAQAKVYGASDPAMTFVATGFQFSDTAATVLTGSLTRAAGEHVGSYAISQGTLVADSDYTISFTGNTLTITPATLTVKADAQAKVYGASDPALTFVATGFQFSDTAATVLTGGLTRAAGEHVGSYAISQGSLAADSDYTISFTGNTLTITPAALTVKADAQTKVYGASDPALTFVATGFQFSDTAATVLTGSLTRATGEHVGSYAISQGSLVANSDYTISFTSNTLTITPATLTVKADPQTKVYGASDPALTSVATGFQFSDTAAAVLTGSLTRAAGEHVGGYAISQGTLVADSDYSISFTGNTLTITPATLTVKADAQTKVYGASDPVLTYVASGFQLGGTAAAVLTGSLTRAAGEHVGGYAISQGSLVADSDYTISFTGNTLTITPATLTVKADAQTKVYGASDPALTFVATGFQFSDTAATVLTGSLTRAAGEHVGGYAISQGSLVADGDYTISFTGNTLTITPATLTVKADAQTKVYGASDPVLTYVASGFQFSDTAATVLTGVLTRAAGEHVGGYAISQGSLAADSDYTISFTGNTLTITPATLTVKADPQTKVYGASDPALTFVATGFQFSNTAATVLTGSLARAAGEHVGGYAISQGSLVADGDYTISFTGNNLTITPATLSVKANSQTKVYGQSDPGLTYAVNGLQFNDTSASVLSGSLVRTAGETVAASPYAITQGTLTANANYVIAFTGNSLAITSATLTVKANPQSKTYGQPDPGLTYVVTGFQFSDTQATVLTGALTRAPGQTVAGSPYAITQGTLAANSNYTISFTGNSLTITQAALTITVNNQTMPFGGPLPLLTITYTGLANGDTAPATPPVVTTTATVTSPIGPYPITATGAADNNYTISYVQGTLKVLGVLNASLEKSKVCFHKDGTKRIEFQGQLTLMGGLIPDDLRDTTTAGHGILTVKVAGKTWYQKNLTFAVKGVDPNQDTETWEYEPREQEEVEIEWKNHVSYNANNDVNVVKTTYGTLASQFIHETQTELRWSYGSIPLPASLSWQGMTLVTINPDGSITPGTMTGLTVDARSGNKVDIYLPAQLNPGDAVKWTAGANSYTQTIGFGTATQVYYNSGGHFDITLPASQDPTIVFGSAPMTSQVTLQIGDSTQVTTAFGVLAADPYLVEGSEHWQWHDIDPDSD